MANVPAKPVELPAAQPEMPLFRFRLRQMLLFVALVSTALAAVVSSQGVAALAVLLAVSVVAAHVFSTAVASRLRDLTDSECAARTRQANSAGGGDAEFFNSQSEIPPLRRSPWHARGSTSLPWLPRLILAGAVLGGAVGATALALSISRHTSVAGLVVGGISSGVVGGWLAFLVGSFYGIFRHGLRDALAEQEKDEAPRQCIDGR